LEPSQIVAQDKAMDFMQNMLPIDLSKYSINLISNSIMYGVPTAKNDNRIIIDILYHLNSTDNDLEIGFAFEKGIMTSCGINSLRGQVIVNKQYTNSLVATRDFLERYQEYTKIDSNNLITMLNNVDTTKNSTVTTENIRLTVTNGHNFGEAYTSFVWRPVINGVEYAGINLVFDTACNFISLGDVRTLYTIGDTSINVSMEQAIDLALENLKYYSYDMYDGVIVKDFKVSRENIVATLTTASVDYELRPYWDIRMTLDEIYPGNVHGIAVFIWANTGEVISYGNMAYGGSVNIDNYDPHNSELTTSAQNQNRLIIGIIILAVIAAVAATSILVIKKRNK
jgi:hypothetical protein